MQAHLPLCRHSWPACTVHTVKTYPLLFILCGVSYKGWSLLVVPKPVPAITQIKVAIMS